MRSTQDALKQGMRAEKHVALLDENADEFSGLEAALVGARRSGATLVVAAGSQARRLCSPGGSQSPPGGSRVPIGWPPERGWGPVPQPGGQQAELFEERRHADGGLGLALIRDGNGTRSFETPLRYRGAAMAEFWRALKTLKALQAEQSAASGPTLTTQPTRRAVRQPLVQRLQPNEPGRGGEGRLEYVPSEPSARALHEPATPWLPNEPEPMAAKQRERLPRGPAWGNDGDAGEGAPARPSGSSSILGK